MLKIDKFSLESVAEASGKPLFAISVADVSLNPQEAEGNLQRLFELAATWRAVMLLWVEHEITVPVYALANNSSSDEADVFLENRSSNTANLDRNALVSSITPPPNVIYLVSLHG